MEKECQICGGKYTCSYRTRNTSKFCSSKCRTRNMNIQKNEKLKDYVICPICNNKFREINNHHIAYHNMTVIEWKEKFPDFDNLSHSSRLKKSTLNNLTKQQSNNLKRGHTLDGYIDKHGEKEGKRRYKERCDNIRFVKTEEYYIQRYGEEKGKKEFEKIQKSKGITLEKYVNKYGKKEGEIRYYKWLDNIRYRSTLIGYIDKYGEEYGYKKWFSKNKKMSVSSSHIQEKDIDEYKKYCINVDKKTRITLQLNELDKIELRGKDYHLDHKISKCYGFNNNIPSDYIASIYNLEIISASDNLKKTEVLFYGVK